MLAGPALPTSLDSTCRWHGYLRWLPQAMHGLPMFWTLEELADLEGTSIAAKMAHGPGNKLAPYCTAEPLCQVSSGGFTSETALCRFVCDLVIYVRRLLGVKLFWVASMSGSLARSRGA